MNLYSLIQEDMQSSPYNSPVDTDESSHSNDSYVREIHEIHYSELISHTSYSPYSFPQHADIPTSSTAFYMLTSSIVADINLLTFPETETGVELIERTETNIDSLDRSIPLSLCLRLPFFRENSSDVSDTQFYSSKCAVCEENAVQRNVSQGAYNQSIFTVVNLSRELKIQSVRYGALVVGSMLGLNNCKKAVYQLREGRINK